MLYLWRKHIVTGRGSIPADVLFIGEAPDASDNLRGQAFVGESGRVLDTLIEKVGIESYYMTNVVLCRPINEFQGANREPTQEEVLACMDNVIKIISKVHPKIVVLLGKVAQKYYGREFPDAIHLQHPDFLSKQGGTRSPYYMTNLRILQEGYNALNTYIS